MEIKSYKKENGETAYKFRVYLGVIDGKKKYVNKQGFKSKSAARKALMSLQEEIDNPESKSTMTFDELTEIWLKGYEKGVQGSTLLKTKRNIQNHISPTIGHYQIRDLTPLIVQKFADQWSEKLKYSSKIVGLVRNILNYAVKYGYIKMNPAELVTTPKVKREAKKEKDFYNKDELKELMQYVYDTDDIDIITTFRLLAFTGVRKGELLALTWDDFRGNTLDINKAVTRDEFGEHIGPTKNGPSERLISLDPETVNILEELHDTYPKTKYILESSVGSWISPTQPRKWLLQILRDNNTKLKPIRIHGFRHTHASLLFESGLSLKQVQHRLGHKNLKVTMDTYVHITEHAVDEIGTKFSQFIDF